MVGSFFTEIIIVFGYYRIKRNLTISFIDMLMLNMSLFVNFYIFVVVKGLEAGKLALNHDNIYQVLKSYFSSFSYNALLEYIIILILIVANIDFYLCFSKFAIRMRMNKMLRFNDFYLQKIKEDFQIYTGSPYEIGYPILLKEITIVNQCKMQIIDNYLAYLRIPIKHIDDNTLYLRTSSKNYLIQNGFLEIPLGGNGETVLNHNYVKLFVNNDNEIIKIQVEICDKYFKKEDK